MVEISSNVLAVITINIIESTYQLKDRDQQIGWKQMNNNKPNPEKFLEQQKVR